MSAANYNFTVGQGETWNPTLTLTSLIAKTYTALVVGRAWAVLETDPAVEVVAGRT